MPGIGKRGAERIVLELRDKVAASGVAASAIAVSGHGMRGLVVEALVGLGFPAKQAEEATDSAEGQAILANVDTYRLDEPETLVQPPGRDDGANGRSNPGAWRLLLRPSS